MTSLLTATGLTAGFGANQVLHGVDLDVPDGSIVGIFGLNGAGKSVTMKVLAGTVPAWSGTVTLAGTDITGLGPEARVAQGVGNVPQGRQVFPELTVEENLRLGAYTSRRRDKAGYPARLARVYEQLPALVEKRSALAGTLSGGQRAALAVGRALINEPKVLLIDEPTAGLAPVVVGQLAEVLAGVRASGMTMVLVEQNVSFGLGLVDTAHVMQGGRVVFAGPTAGLDRDRLAGYLGIGSMLRAGVDRALGSEPPAETPATRRPRRRAPLVATRSPQSPATRDGTRRVLRATPRPSAPPSPSRAKRPRP